MHTKSKLSHPITTLQLSSPYSIPPYPLQQPLVHSVPKSKNHLSTLHSSPSPSPSPLLFLNTETRKKIQLKMSLTIPTNLSKSISTPKLGSQFASKPRTATIICQANSPNQDQSSSTSSQLKAFSAALALSSIIFSAPVLPASADISGLTPCKESKQFAKREKQEIKKLESSLKLYAPDSAPALAIQATIEKTKRR